MYSVSKIRNLYVFYHMIICDGISIGKASSECTQVVLNPNLSSDDPFKISSEIMIHLSLLDVILLTLYKDRAACESSRLVFYYCITLKKRKISQILVSSVKYPP